MPTCRRRSRLAESGRESGGGIVAFDADRDLATACFALGGQIGRADLVDGSAELLDTMAGAFDPRLSPDGAAIAYVAGDELRLVDADGDRRIISEEGDTISWGAAEFIAGEEMGRTRGFWWAPDSQRLLVERVDVAPIDTWWIAAPVNPSQAPSAIRYPAAGTANADCGLAIVGLDGSQVDVVWNDTGEWEYLADASWSAEGLILTVQTRDQRAWRFSMSTPKPASVVNVIESPTTTGWNSCRVHPVSSTANSSPSKIAAQPTVVHRWPPDHRR